MFLVSNFLTVEEREKEKEKDEDKANEGGGGRGDDDGEKEEIFSNFHIEKKIQLLKGKISHIRFSVKNNELKKKMWLSMNMFIPSTRLSVPHVAVSLVWKFSGHDGEQVLLDSQSLEF